MGMPMPRWSSRVRRCRACGRLGVELASPIADGGYLTIHRELLSQSRPRQVVEGCVRDSDGGARAGRFVLD
jgi:hypothetical protein